MYKNSRRSRVITVTEATQESGKPTEYSCSFYLYIYTLVCCVCVCSQDHARETQNGYQHLRSGATWCRRYSPVC